MAPQLSSEDYPLGTELSLKAPVPEQHNGDLCDIDDVGHSPHAHPDCNECAESGKYCLIPVSDAAWIQNGLNTVVEGKRKCLNCAETGAACIFPGGQRPNPGSGHGVCNPPLPLLTDRPPSADICRDSDPVSSDDLSLFEGLNISAREARTLHSTNKLLDDSGNTNPDPDDGGQTANPSALRTEENTDGFEQPGLQDQLMEFDLGCSVIPLSIPDSH